MQWNAKIFEENPEFCRELGNKVGYHFILQQSTVPALIEPGNPFFIQWQWLNDGVAPLYEPCEVAIALLDQNDQIVQKCWVTDSQPKTWLPGVSTKETVTIKCPAIPQGTYKLAVGLFLDKENAAPAYRLGIRGRTAGGWYVLNDKIQRP